MDSVGLPPPAWYNKKTGSVPAGIRTWTAAATATRLQTAHVYLFRHWGTNVARCLGGDGPQTVAPLRLCPGRLARPSIPPHWSSPVLDSNAFIESMMLKTNSRSESTSSNGLNVPLSISSP